MTETITPPATGFYGLGISPKLLEALDKLKFKTPTPIQQKAIPAAASGTDMVGIAQTGTGKTIAFAIPMIQRLAAVEGRGLILVPTRELALQVAEVVKQFAPLLGMATAVVIGGESAGRQRQELFRKPRIIIATPGRLIDHINQRNVNLSDVRVLVLDEADRMFDMGFAPQIEKIIASLSKERQTMLFSATMPDAIMKLAGRHMKLPTRIEVARSGQLVEKVVQELFIVDRGDKPALLGKLLDKYWGSVLLFVRTKHNARKIARDIRNLPHTAAEIHSNRSLSQRREALEGFKSGKYRILVATDIAARGIDVTGIELVINYDLPDEDENYVHRIGRTGRAGQPGRAITFASPDQGKDVRSIERLIRMPLPVSKYDDMPDVKFSGSGEPSQIGEKRRPGPGQRQQQRGPRREAPAGEGQARRPMSSGRPEHGGRPSGPSYGNFSRQPSRGPSQGRPEGGQRRSGPGGRPAGRDFDPRRSRPSGGRESIVSPSPYFENEQPRRRPQNRPFNQERPRPAAAGKPPAAGGNWFTRFIKKNKKDHQQEV
ncbi:MAG TPA: hypothetical protein DCZ92_04790 [Elusimicrobia bacterium]|nr:MAG: hypothetical protein A2016_03570 [Elusimicrobia bacterium GWF2_62_30]HBA60125.1 hypothetical protein [Elusimicrobiota bacterium]